MVTDQPQDKSNFKIKILVDTIAVAVASCSDHANFMFFVADSIVWYCTLYYVLHNAIV